MSIELAVVVDRRGRRTPLGAFVFDLIEQSGRSVSEVARRAELSRSFLYLLKDDKQVPSFDSLVTLFEAIGVDDVRAAEPDEPGELAITVAGRDWWVRLPRTNRRAERSRTAMAALSSPPPYAGPLDDSFVVSATLGNDHDVKAGSSSRAAAAVTYRRDSGIASASDRESRRARMAALLDAAADLDDERLDLLLQHARLLGRR